MRRSPALQSLSRDHHQALTVAQALRRADAAGAGEAAARFLAYWREHGRRHFQIEEDVLLPGLLPYVDPHDPAVVRVLTDHVAIRRLAADLAAAEASPDVAALRELGEQLDAHVRHEERVLFELAQARLPAGRLEEVAAAIAAAEAEG